MGDGSQLALYNFQNIDYIGFDVSHTILQKITRQYVNDDRKTFFHTSEYSNQKADMTLSIDVIYHLIEDDIFHQYMTNLFGASQKYVVIYSPDKEDSGLYGIHVKHRKFSNWIKNNRPDFSLLLHEPNKYPEDSNDRENTSFADFYVYVKDA